MRSTGSTMGAEGGTKLSTRARVEPGSFSAAKERKNEAKRTMVIGVEVCWISSWRGTRAPATAKRAA